MVCETFGPIIWHSNTHAYMVQWNSAANWLAQLCTFYRSPSLLESHWKCQKIHASPIQSLTEQNVKEKQSENDILLHSTAYFFRIHLHWMLHTELQTLPLQFELKNLTVSHILTNLIFYRRDDSSGCEDNIEKLNPEAVSITRQECSGEKHFYL